MEFQSIKRIRTDGPVANGTHQSPGGFKRYCDTGFFLTEMYSWLDGLIRRIGVVSYGDYLNRSTYSFTATLYYFLFGPTVFGSYYLYRNNKNDDDVLAYVYCLDTQENYFGESLIAFQPSTA